MGWIAIRESSSRSHVVKHSALVVLLQGVSGLNRHAKQSDVLTDPKNRLVTTYFDLVKFLKPNYILMEQVGCSSSPV